ncbi:unnamed protein product [Didymodactylos carnosus]|uniref:Uncharacterized protein n=1 Tax=Didymodactylos carnosus TaxID=1234261 RepID=A0A8S2E4N6_9BILA|nr:unnamed protein product [Didymodactylos carnosus]CAF3823248.1 unnamed protein product [Didymodactylos carnosus]
MVRKQRSSKSSSSTAPAAKATTASSLSTVAPIKSKYGYKCYIPQRDGFEGQNQFIRLLLKEEYKKLNNTNTNALLTEEELTTCVQYLIYILDMGRFIPNAHVVLGHIDEPMDEGVVVELTWGRTLGKAVIGWRTDTRPVFGEMSHSLKGIHWFVSNQCGKYIYHAFDNMINTKEATSQLHAVAEFIHEAISTCEIEGKLSASRTAHLQPPSSLQQQWLNHGKVIFDGIENFHAEDNLRLIVQRLLTLKSQGLFCLPTVINKHH